MRMQLLCSGILMTAIGSLALSAPTPAPGTTAPETTTPAHSPEARAAATQPAAKASAAGPGLVVHSGGIESMLVDPKDKGLLAALQMIDDRILELPGETGDHNMPAGAIQFAVQLLFSPMNLRVGMIENGDPKAGPPIFAQLDFLVDAAAAKSYSDRFGGMITSMAHLTAKPSTAVAGMQMINGGGLPVYFGPREVDSKSVFTIGVNGVQQTALKFDTTDLPKDAKPAMIINVDPAPFKPLLDMAMERGGPQAAPMKLQIEMMGVYGDNAGPVTAAVGHSADRSYATLRQSKFRLRLEKSGMLSSKGLAASDLHRIPADATCAQITKYKMSAFGTMIKNLIGQVAESTGQPAQDPMAMIETQTGINPQRDIFDHLGETMGFYTSDTTGGGGLLSAVVFLEVKDSDALNQTIAKLGSMANTLAQRHAKGYVRIADRTVNGQKITALSFPGIPVPLEISLCVSDGYFYAAASPQALVAAIKQGQSGTTSLADNADFKRAGGDKCANAISVSFVDTPRTMRDGYGMVSLLTAALSNVVRSPGDPSRDPGLVMPALSELTAGAMASVSITSFQGDDQVTIMQYDRSLLVNACGFAGMAGTSTTSVATAALLAGVMLPAIGKARDQAQITRSMANLKMISTAIMTYAAEFGDMPPKDLKTLIDKDYITEPILHSPFGPAPDGRGDYWINCKIGKLSDVRFPDQQILGYDRAMYAHGGIVVTLFADAHIQTFTVDDFNAAIQNPANQGVDFDEPGKNQ